MTGAPDGVYAVDPSQAPVPVWAPAAADPTREQGRVGSAIPTGPTPGGAGASGPGTDAAPRISRRPRSGLLVALLVFYCLQLAAAAVAWREAPIRTDALVDPMLAYATCALLVLPALLLRGRWRVFPTLVATAAGTVSPVLLSRDLMEVVGPRDVWVGQSLTLQVIFPLVVGLCAVVALLTAPVGFRDRQSGLPMPT